MEKEVELFDPKFVRFMWDDELEDKKCFVGNSVDFLMSAVERNDKACMPRVTKSSYTPPFAMVGFEDAEDGAFTFAYYDPNYEIKHAFYKEGKTIQLYIDSPWGEPHWDDCVGEPDWDAAIQYRVKPDEKTADLGSYLKPKKWVKFNLNHYVKVKLNEEGERIYLEHFTSTHIALSLMKKPDESGYMTFQMHEFMEIFGSHFGPCWQDVPCDMNVLVEADE